MEGSRLQWKSNMGPIGQIINHFDTTDQDWQNKKGCDGQRGVSPITMSRCGSTWNLSKHQLIKTITVKNAPRQPAVRHFLYNPPNIIQLLPNKFYNLTMVFYQDLLNGQFHSDFASQQPSHWGGSLSRSDLVVDLAELLLYNPLNSVGGHRRVTSIQQFSSNSFWDDSFSKSETLPLCQNTKGVFALWHHTFWVGNSIWIN